jgi:O-antigen ligase
MATLTLWLVLGIPFSIWISGSYQVFAGSWLKILTITFLVSQIVNTKARLRTFLGTLVCCSAVVTFVTLFFTGGDKHFEADRLLGATTGPMDGNFFGIVFAMQLPCVLVFLLYRSSTAKSVILVGWLCLMIRMLFLNASRSGTLTALLALALTCAFVLRRARSARLGLGVSLLLFIGALLAPSLFWARIGTLWDTQNAAADQRLEGSLASLSERQTMLNRSIEYTLENPLFGLGMGNFDVASGTRSGRARDWVGTHNTYTQISSEGGIPALVIFVSLLGYSLMNLRRIARTLQQHPGHAELEAFTLAIMVGLLACSFGALFAHIGYNMYFYPWLGLTVAMQRLAKASVMTNAA